MGPNCHYFILSSFNFSLFPVILSLTSLMQCSNIQVGNWSHTAMLSFQVGCHQRICKSHTHDCVLHAVLVVYRVNRTGPSTDPQGMPCWNRILLELKPFMTTDWSLSLVYKLNYLSAGQKKKKKKKKELSLVCIKWSSVSNAANRSNSITISKQTPIPPLAC